MKAIPVESIRGGEILAKDIYLNSGAVLMSQGAVLRPAYVDRLRSLGHRMVYIVEEEITNLIDCATEQVIQKHCQESVRTVIDKYSYGVDAELNDITGAAENIMQDVLSEPEVLYNVSRVRDKSNSIYLHSINVSALSVLIGVKMRMQERRLKNLAVGSLLHDIGLIYLPVDIRNVNIDTCDASVLKEVRRHVINGYSAVEKENWLPMAAKDIIVNHHERIDGTGYPFRLTGDKISLETKIVSLCDEFDSMVYGHCRNKRKIRETMDYITSQAGVKFDFRVVQVFLSSVAVYPIGTVVELSNGQKGIVVRQNQSLPTSPVVQLVNVSPHGVTPTGEEIDLTKNLTVIITDTIEI